MDTRHRTGSFWQGLVLSALMLCGGLIEAAGLLQPSDGSLPPLEIRDHKVEVVIEDGYAITRVEQVFHNPHNRDLRPAVRHACVFRSQAPDNVPP